MGHPRYTVIVPMRHFRAEEPVLDSLRVTTPSTGPAQILVAEGEHPSLQRNAALKLAQGEVVVFLDNDCRLGADYWAELDAALARPGVEIVGGPARLRADAGAWEEIFHALLTHPLIVGPVSARYAPRGGFRPASERDLILCNLAVKTAVFERVGRFSSRLYPNEENEWLDRAQDAGVGIFYQPGLQVFRPQRASLGEMGRMLYRNGMGRTRQFQVSGWRPTFHQVLPLCLLAGGVVLIGWRLEKDFALLWLGAAVIIALTCDATLRPWQRLVVGLVAPLVPLSYGVGQLLGWIALVFPVAAASAEITVRNERGERAT
jgi:hypothetical protein